jgi:hypothetical protein
MHNWLSNNCTMQLPITHTSTTPAQLVMLIDFIIKYSSPFMVYRSRSLSIIVPEKFSLQARDIYLLYLVCIITYVRTYDKMQNSFRNLLNKFHSSFCTCLMSSSNFCLAIAAESLMKKDHKNMLDYQLSETSC